MISYTLQCRESGHRHEADFPSIAAYEKLEKAGALACPCCGSHNIERAPMAPAIARAGGGGPAAPAPAQNVLEALRPYCVDVGERFPEVARALADGRAEAEGVPKGKGVIGKTTLGDVEKLRAEGVRVGVIPLSKLDA